MDRMVSYINPARPCSSDWIRFQVVLDEHCPYRGEPLSLICGAKAELP